MDYLYSKHAKLVSETRAIKDKWVNDVIHWPILIEKDEKDYQVTRYYGKIEEYGNRVLRVSVNLNKTPVIIISVHFDRSKKGKI
jgi:hypothetical protein